MTAVVITNEDLAPFATIADAKADAMIADAMAMAAQVAPCITTDDFAYPDAAKAILRAAILRWNDQGTGALSAQVAGPFQVQMDTRTERRSLFWPSEIDALQDLCRTGDKSGIFSVDTLGCSTFLTHARSCSINFGAVYCSCGAVLTQYFPLYESIGEY